LLCRPADSWRVITTFPVLARPSPRSWVAGRRRVKRADLARPGRAAAGPPAAGRYLAWTQLVPSSARAVERDPNLPLFSASIGPRPVDSHGQPNVSVLGVPWEFRLEPGIALTLTDPMWEAIHERKNENVGSLIRDGQSACRTLFGGPAGPRVPPESDLSRQLKNFLQAVYSIPGTNLDLFSLWRECWS